MNKNDLSLPPEYRASRFIFGAPWWVWPILAGLVFIGWQRFGQDSCRALDPSDPLGLLTAPAQRRP